MIPSGSINLESFRLDFAKITKKSFCGLIDSLLAFQHTIQVKIAVTNIEPIADTTDTLDYVRQCTMCLVVKDNGNTHSISKWVFKTEPVQHT